MLAGRTSRESERSQMRYTKEHKVKAKEAWTKAVELYEVAHEHPLDDRYKEIKEKLKLLERK